MPPVLNYEAPKPRRKRRRFGLRITLPLLLLLAFVALRWRGASAALPPVNVATPVPAPHPARSAAVPLIPFDDYTGKTVIDPSRVVRPIYANTHDLITKRDADEATGKNLLSHYSGEIDSENAIEVTDPSEVKLSLAAALPTVNRGASTVPSAPRRIGFESTPPIRHRNDNR
jgi:hypothetical protein